MSYEYKQYVNWCKSIGVKAATEEVWERITSSISPNAWLPFQHFKTGTGTLGGTLK